MISKISSHQQVKLFGAQSYLYPKFFSKCSAPSYNIGKAVGINNPEPFMSFRTCSSSTVITSQDKYYPPRFSRNLHKIEKPPTPAQQKKLFEKLSVVRKKVMRQNCLLSL